VVGSTPTSKASKESLAQMMVGREVGSKFERQAVEAGASYLRLENVCAQSDRNMPALRGVNLEVHAGEIMGVAGVSGNGQRELAEVITGLRRVTDGKIHMLGAEMTGKQPGEIMRQGLSYIPEERMRDGIIKEFSVSENTILREHHQSPFARLGFFNFKEISAYTRKLVKNFNVKTPTLDTPMKNLSGGNIQKLILARELSRKPKVVVAAQPTRGLDIGATEYVHLRLMEQREEGAAILLISEDLDEILALADRIAVIYEGQIMDVLPRGAATSENLGLLMAGVRQQT
jgi:simple sugar transport system ATP-binding protein